MELGQTECGRVPPVSHRHSDPTLDRNLFGGVWLQFEPSSFDLAGLASMCRAQVDMNQTQKVVAAHGVPIPHLPSVRKILTRLMGIILTCTCNVVSWRVSGNSNDSSHLGLRFFLTIFVFFGLFLPTKTSAYGSEKPLGSALRTS
jgi:hypothetical protein